MEIKLVAGPRDEKMIDLVKSTVENCQSDEPCIKVMNSKGEIRDVPHVLGSCRNCCRCKYDCDLMDLCYQYGFDKVYDAVFYAYGGNSRILKDIESFIWENMTQEDYSLYLEWLSNKTVMTS